ncbi:MAG TPA: hypothetical protein VJ437_06200 [Acidiferrobacterales bacterium]|nr:hypothetical protein [Acidiferrobacterales bacterium]
MPTRELPAHVDLLGVEVDVAPLETKQFALAQACGDSHEYYRPPVFLCRV